MSKNTFIPTTKGLVSATKSQDFSSGEKAQATTNIGAVALAGSYSDPAWITALAASKITGTFMKSQQHAQTAFYDQAGTFTQAQNIGTLNLASGAISSPSSLTIAAGNAWNDGSSIQLLNANTVVFEAKATGVTSNVPLIVGAAATLNGPLTINKTGSNGLVVNNTVGNALAIFNASSGSVTDNAYLTIQTAGADRWYVGQSVSALTGNFEIYGTGFGGSMLTLNRTTGAMTANAATFNGTLAATQIAEFGKGINALGPYPHGSAALPGVISYEYPYTRNFTGDGSGYTWAVSKRSGGVTTDLFTIYDASGAVNIKGNDVHLQGSAGGWSSQYAFKGSSGTNRGGFGAAGASDTLEYYWIGPSLSSPYVKLSSTGATFTGTVTAEAFRHRNTAGEFPWMLYSPGTDVNWYIRDMVNSRMQMMFTPGASSSAAVTNVYSQLTVEGNATFNNTSKLGDFTAATLPSAASNAGHEANVTDSSVTTFGSTVAGGGSSRVKVYSNGTNWTVQAA